MKIFTYVHMVLAVAVFVHGLPFITSPVPPFHKSELSEDPNAAAAAATKVLLLVLRAATPTATPLPTDATAPTNTTGPTPAKPPQAHKVAGFLVLLVGAFAVFLSLLFRVRALHARQSSPPTVSTTPVQGTGNTFELRPARRRSTYDQQLPAYPADAPASGNLAVPAQPMVAPRYTPATEPGTLPPLYEEPQDEGDPAATPVSPGRPRTLDPTLPVRHGSHPRLLRGERVIVDQAERRSRFSSW